MFKIENSLFFILAFSMAFVVAISNYLVQFPIKYFNLQDLLTYGAFTYPIAFLITDLSNRRYGKRFADWYMVRLVRLTGFPCIIPAGCWSCFPKWLWWNN